MDRKARGFHLMDLSENAERALRMVREAKEIVYDTETTGVDWRFHKPVGYVVGAASSERRVAQNDVVYVPVRHGGGGNLPGAPAMTSPTEGYKQHPFEAELARAFTDRNQTVGMGRVIGHNMKFDVHMSANGGVMLGRNLACTQNMASMADEYARKYSLEAVAERYNVTAKKGEDLYKHLAATFGGVAKREAMANFWQTSGTDSVVYEYTVGDGVSTLEAYWKLYDALIADEMKTVMDLENDLIWTVFRMERRGIKVDLKEADSLRRATEDRVSELMASFPLGFNPLSPVQMKALMESNGHTDWPLTEKGAPSFANKWLKTNAVGKRVIEMRQARNLINSFIDPLVKEHTFNGRVHATLNQLKSDETGTISGRFSCSDPNLQQVPKHNKELAKPFRRLFVADENWVFWERDYSQAEPRTFAHYAGAKNLLEGYNSKPFKDMHSVTAELLGVERDPTAKRMGMGILTGMQSKALAGHMGCTEEQARRYMDQFFGAYPEIRDFQNRAKARLKQRGYVFTLLGRRCRLESPQYAYRGTSKIIQGSNADIMKYKLLEADRACESIGDIVHIAMVVHDSYNGQYQNTPEARRHFEEIVLQLANVQSDPFNLAVPFVLEGTEGANWAEATFGSKG
jgi:DNA polymerase I